MRLLELRVLPLVLTAALTGCARPHPAPPVPRVSDVRALGCGNADDSSAAIAGALADSVHPGGGRIVDILVPAEPAPAAGSQQPAIEITVSSDSSGAARDGLAPSAWRFELLTNFAAVDFATQERVVRCHADRQVLVGAPTLRIRSDTPVLVVLRTPDGAAVASTLLAPGGTGSVSLQ